MSVHIDVQHACAEQAHLPAESDLQRWVDLAWQGEGDAELTIRIVDEAESRTLNRDYRGKDKSTNVLSFPMEMPEDLQDEMDVNLLGDLVICAPVVAQEATEQHKSLQHHWAHMVIHGMLHLQGYDHIREDEAEEMESLETELLQQLGIDDPYGTDK